MWWASKQAALTIGPDDDGEVEFCDNDHVDDGEDEDLMLRMVVVMSAVPKPGNF